MDAERKHRFKKGLDLENYRRRREDTTIGIRKQKREENLAKRRLASSARNKGVSSLSHGLASSDSLSETSNNEHDIFSQIAGLCQNPDRSNLDNFFGKEIPKIQCYLSSANPEEQLIAAKVFESYCQLKKIHQFNVVLIVIFYLI